jgi:hypothetical protein
MKENSAPSTTVLRLSTVSRANRVKKYSNLVLTFCTSGKNQIVVYEPEPFGDRVTEPEPEPEL